MCRILSFLLVFVLAPALAKAQLSSKIINGTSASATDLVAMSTVAIQMPSEQNGNTVYVHCTAFIIAPNILMTAAHCLYFLSDKLPVEAIFSLTPNFGPDDGTQTRVGLSDYQIEPDYYENDNGVYNDVALIKLKSNVPAGYEPLAFDWNSDSALSPGVSLLVAGYGVTSDFNEPDPLPPMLRYANVPFVGGDTASLTTSDQLIVDQTNAGFCAGDSGGPLFIVGRNQLAPVGIVSHVTLNAQGHWSCKAEGAFTHIVYFKTWIQQAIAALQ